MLYFYLCNLVQRDEVLEKLGEYEIKIGIVGNFQPSESMEIIKERAYYYWLKNQSELEAANVTICLILEGEIDQSEFVVKSVLSQLNISEFG